MIRQIFIKIERSLFRSWFSKFQILISIFWFFFFSLYIFISNVWFIKKFNSCLQKIWVPCFESFCDTVVSEWKQSTYLIAVSGLHTSCAREVACRESRWPRTCVCLKFEPTVTYHSRFFFTLLHSHFRKDCASTYKIFYLNEINRNH